MERYVRQYEIQWSDLDVNRHVANFAYSRLMTDTRISFLREHGFSMEMFEQLKMGPVIFSEEFHYLREVKHGETVHIDAELLAHTEDYKYMKQCHCLYNSKGKAAVYSEIYYSWFDLVTRKLVAPPEELIRIYQLLPKAERFTLLNKADLKISEKVPLGRVLER